MAIRPVFYTSHSAPFYFSSDTDFVWVKGMALSQQQKNVAALHDAFQRRFPEKKVLEISSKSTELCGVAASAFSLQKFVPSLGRSVYLESVFQSSKVFQNGGPFTDILEKMPKDAKGDERLKNSGSFVGFRFEGQDYPTEPKHIFYDYLYISALIENPTIADALKEYDAFSDIAFNPQKSINCQARSAAIFVSLSKLGLLEEIKDFASFAALFQVKITSPEKTEQAIKKPEILRTSLIASRVSEPTKEEKQAACSIEIHDTVEHRFFKKGKVLSVSPEGYVRILFDAVGEKTIAYDFLVKNCKILK